jgi:hydrogenase-4 membrane subunit HyfE
MGNFPVPSDFSIKLNLLKTNLKSWTYPEWVFFFILIPALLFLIYLLPQEIKDSYFILDTGEIWRLQTYILNSYTHSQLYPHLVSNIIVYFFALLAVFSFENNGRRFRLMAVSSFLVVPIISSLLTIGLFRFLGLVIRSQGFSAVVAAFIAYTLICIVLWILGDKLENFDHPEYFRSRLLFYLMCCLLALILALIVIEGMSLGLFMNAGDSTNNGIAHFGGFITGLIVFLVYDTRTEQRKYFHMSLGIAIGMGILWYGNYLVTLVKMVNGG